MSRAGFVPPCMPQGIKEGLRALGLGDAVEKVVPASFSNPWSGMMETVRDHGIFYGTQTVVIHYSERVVANVKFM